MIFRPNVLIYMCVFVFKCCPGDKDSVPSHFYFSDAARGEVSNVSESSVEPVPKATAKTVPKQPQDPEKMKRDRERLAEKSVIIPTILLKHEVLDGFINVCRFLFSKLVSYLLTFYFDKQVSLKKGGQVETPPDSNCDVSVTSVITAEPQPDRTRDPNASVCFDKLDLA